MLNDNEIIKGLACCGHDMTCDHSCPYVGDSYCIGSVTLDALSLINRQKAELLKEKNKNSKLRNERNRLKREIEALDLAAGMWKLLAERYENYLTQARTDAITEFAERLKGKQKQINITYNLDYDVVFVSDIDTIVKEMVGDTDDM